MVVVVVESIGLISGNTSVVVGVDSISDLTAVVVDLVLGIIRVSPNNYWLGNGRWLPKMQLNS
jgi:hypothetical protein